MTEEKKEGLVVRIIVFMAIIAAMVALDAYWFRPEPTVQNVVVLDQLKDGQNVVAPHSSKRVEVIWIELGVAAFAGLTMFGRELFELVNDK